MEVSANLRVIIQGNDKDLHPMRSRGEVSHKDSRQLSAQKDLKDSKGMIARKKAKKILGGKYLNP